VLALHLGTWLASGRFSLGPIFMNEFLSFTDSVNKAKPEISHYGFYTAFLCNFM
jgi:hypothetical protein